MANDCMDVELLPVESLTPYENNPRRNDDAVDAVAASIREFGFQQPIVVDSEGTVVVGHTRLKAAKRLGMERVPVVVAALVFIVVAVLLGEELRLRLQSRPSAFPSSSSAKSRDRPAGAGWLALMTLSSSTKLMAASSWGRISSTSSAAVRAAPTSPMSISTV